MAKRFEKAKYYTEKYKKKSKKTFSLDEIRELFGSEKITQKQSLLA